MKIGIPSVCKLCNDLLTENFLRAERVFQVLGVFALLGVKDFCFMPFFGVLLTLLSRGSLFSLFFFVFLALVGFLALVFLLLVGAVRGTTAGLGVMPALVDLLCTRRLSFATNSESSFWSCSTRRCTAGTATGRFGVTAGTADMRSSYAPAAVSFMLSADGAGGAVQMWTTVPSVLVFRVLVCGLEHSASVHFLFARTFPMAMLMNFFSSFFSLLMRQCTPFACACACMIGRRPFAVSRQST